MEYHIYMARHVLRNNTLLHWQDSYFASGLEYPNSLADLHKMREALMLSAMSRGCCWPVFHSVDKRHARKTEYVQMKVIDLQKEKRVSVPLLLLELAVSTYREESAYGATSRSQQDYLQIIRTQETLRWNMEAESR